MDSDSDKPADLRAFPYSCIDSVDQVDLLIRLRHSHSAQTVRQLSAVSGLATVSVRRHLETLVVRGLLRAVVAEEVGYRYAPESPGLRRYADLLEHLLLEATRPGDSRDLCPRRADVRRRIQVQEGAMIAAVVYVLCAVTSAICALLLRQSRRQRSRLLFWNGLSFVGFALTNAFVFADFVVLPDVDLSVVRAAAGLVAVAILLFGLVWEAD
jgi:uncharacterized protein DUF5985/IclR-like helix-turn-helix domain-containing protein